MGVDGTDDDWKDFFSCGGILPFKVWLIGSKPRVSKKNVFFANIGDIQ